MPAHQVCPAKQEKEWAAANREATLNATAGAIDPGTFDHPGNVTADPLAADGPANKRAPEPTPREISNYIRFDVVQALATRIEKMPPRGIILPQRVALELSQVALIVRLNPYITGEVWPLWNPESSKYAGIMIGRDGWRKIGRRHCRLTGDHFWIRGEQITKIENYTEDPGAIVFKAKLKKTSELKAHAEIGLMYSQAGATWDQANAALGPTPEHVGIGIFGSKERKPLLISKIQATMNRAERAALRMGFEATIETEIPDGIQIATDSDFINSITDDALQTFQRMETDSEHEYLEAENIP